MTADDIPADLPTPTGLRLPLPSPRRAGWWKDPAKSHSMAVRYHDGTRWTEFVCNAARTIVTPIERIPLPPDIADDVGEKDVGKEAKGSESAHVTSLIRYIALAFISVCFLGVSDLVPRDSTAFDWTNRIGALLLLALTVRYGIKDLWATLTGRRSGLSWVERWAVVLVSIIIPAVLVLKLWDRLLDALWLK